MDLIISSNFAACQEVVNGTFNLLLYSHLPTTIIALLVGAFVFLHGRNKLPNKLLFLISLLFATWSILDLVVWTFFSDPSLIVFIWSLFGSVYLSIFLLSYYFFSVLINQRDISTLEKAVGILMLVPVLVLAPLTQAIQGYDAVECIAAEGVAFSNYYYLASLAVFFGILIVGIVRYIQASHERKRFILVLSLGIEAFLFMFFTTGFVANFLVEKGYTGDFHLEQYGLFGMAFFIGLLSFLIVRYQTFNIKLLGAQALVVSAAILVGSQFFFIQNPINRVLNTITFISILIFGYFLVMSVKHEVEQRERLEKLTKELQKITRKLANANSKLEGANKELARLDASKSEFLSIASHQLRTPLTVIKGYTSMLQEGSFGKVPPKILEVLNKVYISTERLIGLVEDLLNISRIEAGRIEFNLQPVNLTETVTALVTDFQQKAAAKNLKLEFTPDKNVPEASADPQKVKEVISNILDNAIKYTEQGTINVGLHQESQSIVFTSLDTGLGIEPEDLPRLFNKFVRGKGMQQVHTEGTGLGLYFARMVVEQMGGRIWAESEGKGKGSKFSFSLPMADKGKATKIK